MAEVKWIKIVVDIFDDEKIKLIEDLPDYDSIIVCWFKLLCLAGKQNNFGILMLNDRIPYTDEMLASVFRRPLQTVRLALETFEQFGMIEVINGTITIPNWEKHQNLDKMEEVREQTRKRVQRYRDRQRQLIAPNACQYCGDAATGYDHIIPLARGGKDTEDNKVPCCIRCNRIKNDKPLVDFLNANRDIINDDIVLSNDKLSRQVTLSNVTGRYIVTERNAIEEDIEEDIDTDIENIKAAKPQRSKAFKPPTVEEVAAYCAERQNGIDAQAFIDYYAGTNWFRGKTKIKDWKACVRTWEKRDRESPPHEKPKSKPKQYTTAQEYNARDRKPISADALEDIKRSFGLK